MPDLLSRVNLSVTLDELIKQIVGAFNLGSVESYKYIPIGFEDLNIKLETEKGKYVVKIFSKDRNRLFIQDYIHALVSFSKEGIPTPNLVKAGDKYFYSSDKRTYLCVMEFFEGKDFNKISPTNEDFVAITKYLAKLHKFDFKVHDNYDTWATSHLLEEFPKKAKYLQPNDYDFIQPIIQELKTVDLSKFRQCVIHGALEKQNILKNAQGKYCILDLGCMDFNVAVIDLAIFLAAFCLNPSHSFNDNRLVYDLVLQEYLKTHPLSSMEIKTLPLLVRASYAAYAVTSNYLIVKDNDTSVQAKRFLSLGQNGLRAFQAL